MTKHSRSPRFLGCSFFVALVLLTAVLGHAQTESATMSGTVMDRSGAVVADASVEVTNSDTNVSVATRTNKSGIYVVTALRPGRYRMAVTKEGFRSIVVTDITLNVQDTVSRNFNLDVGAFSESITVSADQTNINTTDATVSTVVDRNFAENLPMNGRSFQTLIDLTPGVVVTPSNRQDNGQFSVNGQRPSSNYWMVDGVSANIGISATGGSSVAGNGFSGSSASFSTLGGTNSLVSVDAMQEFRIQTSTFAPEFGRTPGAQVSIVTRSGTNQFHGTAFEYLRNDVLDANDWFNTAVAPALPKAKERQNDFGGTFSGPIVKDRTFFFFSYEGLRLRLPATQLTTVPDANPADPLARQNAAAGMQPYLNSFPVPNGPQAVDATGTPIPGAYEFNASFSNPASLDAYSLRIDHKLSNSLTLFGRYNYSPSTLMQRGGPFAELNNIESSRITAQTATLGTTWIASPRTVNDLRVNYSRTSASDSFSMDNFGGAVPLATLPFPSGFNGSNGQFNLFVFSLQPGDIIVGQGGDLLQRQVNAVDSLSIQKGSHSIRETLNKVSLSTGI